MNYREKMREYIKSPRDGSSIHYGKWCALNQEQTNYITRLLNEMDRADDYIKKLFLDRGKLQQENKQLKLELDKYKEAIAKFKDLKTLIGVLHNNNLRFSFNEILQELEKGE